MADTAAAGDMPAGTVAADTNAPEIGEVFNGPDFNLKRIRKSVFAALLDSKRRYGSK